MLTLLKNGFRRLLRHLLEPLPNEPGTPRWLWLARALCRLLQARRP